MKKVKTLVNAFGHRFSGYSNVIDYANKKLLEEDHMETKVVVNSRFNGRLEVFIEMNGSWLPIGDIITKVNEYSMEDFNNPKRNFLKINITELLMEKLYSLADIYNWDFTNEEFIDEVYQSLSDINKEEKIKDYLRQLDDKYDLIVKQKKELQNLIESGELMNSQEIQELINNGKVNNIIITNKFKPAEECFFLMELDVCD